MELNKIHNINFLNNTLPDKCASLIIADPPYYEVKGDFDFIWANFDEYLADVERWAKECKRLLADNGTLFWWGHAKKIAYNQIILDKYFTLLNNAVWVKKSCQTKKQSPEAARCFAPITERCLVYSLESDATGLEIIKYKHWGEISPFSKIILNNLEAKKITIKEISLLQLSKNGNPTGWVTNKIKFGQLPTTEQWDLICGLFKISNNYESLRQEYEALRQEYEALRRPFVQTQLQTDVWEFDQEAHITGKFDHPTQKPPKLCNMIINTSTRANDLVVVPFAGSGSECEAAAKYGRQFIGFDIEQKYCDIANKRVADVLNSPQLF